MNLLTTILLSLFGILWLILRITFEKHILTQENRTLSIIGWNERTIFLRNCVEQYFILTVAFVFSLILMITFQLEVKMYVITLVLWSISLLLSTLLLYKKDKRNPRVERYKKFASILYYKRLIIPMMLLLCLSILLISIQLAVLGESFSQSAETTLGQFIGEQAFWFQIAVSALVIYLSIAAFSEGLNTLFAERKREFQMYHVIGWTKKKVLCFIFKESASWFLVSSLFALIIAGIILYQLGISVVWMAMGLGASFIIMSIILCGVLLTRRYIIV